MRTRRRNFVGGHDSVRIFAIDRHYLGGFGDVDIESVSFLVKDGPECLSRNDDILGEIPCSSIEYGRGDWSRVVLPRDVCGWKLTA